MIQKKKSMTTCVVAIDHYLSFINMEIIHKTENFSFEICSHLVSLNLLLAVIESCSWPQYFKAIFFWGIYPTIWILWASSFGKLKHFIRPFCHLELYGKCQWLWSLDDYWTPTSGYTWDQRSQEIFKVHK